MPPDRDPAAATLGGEGDHVYSDDEIALIRKTLREELAPRRSRSWSLWAAMADPSLEVFRYTREGDPRQTNYYFSADEAEKQADAPGAQGKWQRQEMVTTPGKPFAAEGTRRSSTGWPIIRWTAFPSSSSSTGWKTIRLWSNGAGPTC